MGWLLPRCPDLRTFIWEDYTHIRDDSDSWAGDSDEEVGAIGVDVGNKDDSVELGLEEFLTQRPGAATTSDPGQDDDESDEDLNLHCSPGERDRWPPGCEPPNLFKPSLLLALLAETHGSTLEQLGMTISKDSEFCPMGVHIQPWFKVLHFLDFKVLTCLEFDTRILRNRRGSKSSFPPLAKVLPQSLQMLGLIINQPFEEILGSTLKELLESLPAAGFVRLRKVSVRLSHELCAPRIVHSETQKYLHVLRQLFKQVNVIFEWIPVNSCRDVQAGLDWNGKANIVDSIDAFSFRT
jgi:hypothetical protein